jgi:hypothetical protein
MELKNFKDAIADSNRTIELINTMPGDRGNFKNEKLNNS